LLVILPRCAPAPVRPPPASPRILRPRLTSADRSPPSSVVIPLQTADLPRLGQPASAHNRRIDSQYLWWIETSRSWARSSGAKCPSSSPWTSARVLAPRCFENPPHDGAPTLRAHFPSIRLRKGRTPSSCRNARLTPKSGRPHGRPPRQEGNPVS
jgi:hypothetical protein